MQQSTRSVSPILVLSLLLIACSGGGGDGGGGTAPVVAEAMQKTSGDSQSGAPGATLPHPLEVKVTTGSGVAVPGFTVSFSTSAGSVSPQRA